MLNNTLVLGLAATVVFGLFVLILMGIGTILA